MRKEDREKLENKERELMMMLESWARITIARHRGEKLIPRTSEAYDRLKQLVREHSNYCYRLGLMAREQVEGEEEGGGNTTISTPFPLKAADTLGNFTQEEAGFRLVLDHKSFPTCFPQYQPLEAGSSVPIEVQGLPTQSPITVYFDTQSVFEGLTANDNNNVTIIEQFTIPANSTNGLHPITFAVDGTGVSAVCEIDVVGDIDAAASDATTGEAEEGVVAPAVGGEQGDPVPNFGSEEEREGGG